MSLSTMYIVYAYIPERAEAFTTVEDGIAVDEFVAELLVEIMESETACVLAVGDVLAVGYVLVVGKGTFAEDLVGKNVPTVRRNVCDTSK